MARNRNVENGIGVAGTGIDSVLADARAGRVTLDVVDRGLLKMAAVPFKIMDVGFTLETLSIINKKGSVPFYSFSVDMSKHSAENWYAKDATQATADLGAKGRDLILAEMRKVLG